MLCYLYVLSNELSKVIEFVTVRPFFSPIGISDYIPDFYICLRTRVSSVLLFDAELDIMAEDGIYSVYISVRLHNGRVVVDSSQWIQ